MVVAPLWQDAVAELSRVAEESLLGIGTVRALGAEERPGWRWR